MEFYYFLRYGKIPPRIPISTEADQVNQDQSTKLMTADYDDGQSYQLRMLYVLKALVAFFSVTFFFGIFMVLSVIGFGIDVEFAHIIVNVTSVLGSINENGDAYLDNK